MNYKYESDAKVQFMDLNGDGVQEITRSGTVYKAEWDQKPGLKEAELIENDDLPVPIEFKEGVPVMNSAGISSCYQAVYIFRQTFFYDEEFRHYIQYKAKVIRDTESAAAGTRVGVLGILSEVYTSLLPLAPISVVLPDSRIIQLPDGGILEKIYEADWKVN